MRRLLALFCVLAVWMGFGTCQAAFASDLSEVLFTKGVMYYDLGRYELAVENFLGAVREDPANLEVRKYLFLAQAKAAGKPSAVAVYEDAVRKEPGGAHHHLNLAAALSMAGQNDRAMGPSEEAVRLAPQSGEALFFRGLIRLKKGAFRDAIGDFQKARNLEPRLAQGAMFYEGFAWTQLRDRKAAAGLFQRVVEANPLSDYAAEAARHGRSAEGPRFTAKLTTGVEYDTNVTIQGRENSLGVRLDVPDKYQFRFPFSSLMDYRFLDVGEWTFGARHGFYASVHDESSDMNVIGNVAELYGIWRAGEWYLRPFYYYQSVFLGGDQLSDTHTVGGSMMYYAPYNLAPELYVRAQTREFNFPTLPTSDPDAYNLRGEYNQYYLLQGGRGYLRAGLGMEGNLADGESQDYNAFLILAGFQYQLPWRLLFNFDFEYQKRSYTHVHSLFGIERDDLQYSLAWQLSRPLGAGFEVKGRVAHIRNDSNIGEFDYDRQIYSLLFSWSY